MCLMYVKSVKYGPIVWYWETLNNGSNRNRVCFQSKRYNLKINKITNKHLKKSMNKGKRSVR